MERTRSAMGILMECFRKEDQPLKEFAAEIKELKKLPDYKVFVEECAKHLGCEVSWT